MTDSFTSKVPELESPIRSSLISGGLAMAAVMLALPITQHITMPRIFDDDIYSGPDIINPPDEFWVPPPPPPVNKDKDIKLVEETPQPLDLNQLDIIMQANVTSYASTDWTIPGGFGQAITEMIHAISDLTDPPRALRRAQPVYPLELKRAGIEGDVLVEFVVRSNGTVSNIEVRQAAHPAFAAAVVKSVRKWQFEPGKKDGQAVHTRVRQAIPFRIR